MVAINPELLGGTLIFTIAYAIFGIAVTIISLWLNFKQSRVKDTQDRQIQILEEIRDLLKK